MQTLAPDAVDLRDTLKRLSRPHSLAGVYHLAEVWAVIAAAIYTSAVLLPPASGLPGLGVYLGALAVIASRQHALMVLGHEAIHKRWSPNMWVNDWLGRGLALFPVFISLAKWRFIHLCHHQHTHTADDPDRAIYARYPLAASAWWRLLARDVCGLNLVSTLKYFIDLPYVTADFNRRFLGQARERRYRQVSDMRAFWAFWGLVLIGGGSWGGTSWLLAFVLYWLIPYCSLTQIFFRVRGAIEHGNVPDPDNPYRRTRTYFMHPIAAFFLAPKRVNYHLEHHLYPAVPFYHLPRLHRVLRREVYPREHAYYERFGQGMGKLVG